MIDFRKTIKELEERHAVAHAVLLTCQDEAKTARQGVMEALEAQKIVQEAALCVQQQAHERIAKVVTRCLAAIFENPYEFRIEFRKSRGTTEAVLVFERDGLVLQDDPLSEVGGGVIDVAAFALRLACLMLARPPLRRLLVLDEPWKNIRGLENRQRVRCMAESLSQELGVQMILNIDLDAYPEFEIGTVIWVGDEEN